jgi:hypothetical protein
VRRESEAANERGLAADTRRRRDGRGLGPFTSGHLTVVTVTVVMVMAFPFAAGAVTGSSTFITDATSGAHASVDSGHNLHAAVVDPAGVNVAKVDAKNNLNTAVHDALSGVAAKVNSLGQQLAAITGSVTANVAYPTSAIVLSGNGIGPLVYADDDCGSGSCTKLIAPPAGKALVVTSIHVNTEYDSAPGASLYFYRSIDGTCSTPSLDLTMEAVTPPGLGMTDLQYDLPGGMPIPAGTALCMANGNTGTTTFAVTAWGYSVASNAVATASPASGAPTGAALLLKHKH